MVLFRDITAPSDALLAKGFCHDKPWALELKHRLTAPSLVENAFLKEDGTVVCSANSSFTTYGDVVVNGSLNVDGTAAVGCQIPCCFTNTAVSANLSRKLTAKQQVNQTIEVAADFKKAPWQVKTAVQPLAGTWNVSTCASWKLNQDELKDGETATVGCEVVGNKVDVSALKCSIAASWTKPIAAHKFFGSLKVAPQGKTSFGRVSAAVKGVSPASFGSEMGAEFVYIVPEERSEMSIGASWYLDPQTKNTQVKAKLDHQGKVVGLLSHKVSDTVTVGLGVQFDATKAVVSANDKSSPYRVGLKLNLLA
eukprot:Protomagalhaensia_wolfi_Nauph_80__2650@NODE_278_length_2942_cov_65_535653_g208_i0_p2_GENE_NODE_278_length_2942_cov_65_535653_g208_i0NODE_278_length_2942_cov_65_535653_g208_i0_p2_ORF_typecomplete_len309_score45_63Porin_3/PF01459_22/1_2e15Bactofilin/PF04519_13/0_98Bactofilin/PF04519_13/5_3e03Bactofilin/PF04519_13/7_2e02_NODE_278_length_2942_cov_65_535653_g208_i013862312